MHGNHNGVIWSSNLLSRLAGNRTSVPMYFVIGFIFHNFFPLSLDGGVLLIGGIPPFSGREKNKAGGRSDISLGLINLINQVQLLGVAILFGLVVEWLDTTLSR